MSALDSLLDSVKNAITQHVQQGGHTNFDTGGLLGKITDLFGSHQSSAGSPAPASRDPYGDPGRSPHADAKPASQDPYGDPADEKR